MYDRKGILRDFNEQPVPQYWNPEVGEYEVISSSNGMLRFVLVDENGEYTHTQSLIDQINTQIQVLVEVAEQIGI